jgi:hypothetical protein
MKLEDCLRQEALDGEGSPEWTSEVFQRAYCIEGGPFQQVRRRLELGFSVLVYLPGSCIDPAADFVKKFVKVEGGKAGDWKVYGEHPGPGKGMEFVWDQTAGIIAALLAWLGTNRTSRPNAIFKNLDRLFSDNNHGMIQNPGAQMALFSLVRSTQGARTLGLANRDFGKLPEAVELAFAERIWINEIDEQRFPHLVPRELGEKLAVEGDGRLPEGVVWMLGSRLRWGDPVRAAMVMRSIGKKCRERDIRGILGEAWENDRPMNFASPTECFPDDPQRVKDGFPSFVLEPLERGIVRPYRVWKRMTGEGQQDCRRQLAKLPPGVILYGPPGTGKTYLAKWIAREIDLPIRVVSGAELRVPDFGGTERNIVRLFREARRAAPCVIVLDDADDLLLARSEASGAVAGAERAIVHTMLQELAGFGGRLAGVLVILTTNRFQHLDEAIQGRIPLHVPVPYPISEKEVSAIVRSVADDYGFDLAADGVLGRLIKRFLSPVIAHLGFKAPATPEERMRVRGNLFSPREIQHAMRLLEGESAEDRPQSYCVTHDDVDRMERHFKQLASVPEIEEKIARLCKP